MSRIFILDDQPLLVVGLATFLEHHGHQIVGRERAASDVLHRLETAAPDILICGHTMPGMTAVELLQTLRGQHNNINFILYVGSLGRQIARAAIDAGVNAILTKDEAPEHLLESIRIVQQGGLRIDAQCLRLVMQDSTACNSSDDLRWPNLSVAERRIASYAASGLHNREIASQSGLTEGTVKVHLNRIFRKLGIDSRLQLIRDFGVQA